MKLINKWSGSLMSYTWLTLIETMKSVEYLEKDHQGMFNFKENIT